MQLQENTIQVNGTRLCWFEQGQTQDGQESILLVHATGFHARCWDQVIRRLPDRHVISVDMRGHGRSDNTPPFSWDTYGADLTAFIKALDLTNLAGVGHSMGGHCLTQAAYAIQDRFTRLVLVDPVIMPPDIYAGAEHEHNAWLDESGEHPVARRRNQFASAEAFFQNLHGRGGYSSWLDDVLHDYCEYGVLPDPDGDGVVLACPPKVEASIYMGSSGINLHELIPTISLPVKVLRARVREGDRTTMDFSVSPTWPELAAAFHQGVDVYLPELTHFIPMQDPELTAAHILDQTKR